MTANIGSKIDLGQALEGFVNLGSAGGPKTEGAEGAGKVLEGQGIQSVGITDLLDRLGGIDPEKGRTSLLALIENRSGALKGEIEILEKEMEAMKNTIDNLKPSEKEIELRKRKLQELQELQRLVSDQSVSYEKLLNQFQNAFIGCLDPADLALFEKLFSSENPQVVA